MQYQAGCRIERGSVVSTLVVGLGVLLHAEKIHHMHHSDLMQDFVGLVWNFANASLFVIDFDAGEILGESLFEPGIGMEGQIPIHQAMGIFVKHNAPWVFDRHVEHDETAIFAALEQASQLCRLSVKDRSYLPYFFAIPKGDNL